MKRLRILMMTVLFVALAQVAGATTFTIFNSAWNNDGAISSSFAGGISGGISYTVTFNTAGPHYSALFVDSEIDEAVNTYYNEYGAVNGTPLAGLWWEIDEPGFGNPDTGYIGNIYSNFALGTLDGTIFDGTFTGPEDIAMALAWDFSLAAGQTATASFNISPTMPTGGFYLMQTDLLSQATLYFSSTLSIEEGGGPQPIPEPSAFVLFGSALAGVGLYSRKRKNG